MIQKHKRHWHLSWDWSSFQGKGRRRAWPKMGLLTEVLLHSLRRGLTRKEKNSIAISANRKVWLFRIHLLIHFAIKSLNQGSYSFIKSKFKDILFFKDWKLLLLLFWKWNSKHSGGGWPWAKLSNNVLIPPFFSLSC